MFDGNGTKLSKSQNILIMIGGVIGIVLRVDGSSAFGEESKQIERSGHNKKN